MKISKNSAKKPIRLTKEQREAKKAKIAERKAKLASQRAQKKAARLAKLEAKKQKAAEKRAAAKAKREAKKAKELAKHQLMRERKAQKKLDAKLKKDSTNKLAKRAKIQRNIVEKSSSLDEVNEKPRNAKLEAERAEFKALSGIRRYIKDHLKELVELDGVKREKKIKKLSKMGYSIVEENGVVCSMSYSFTASNAKAKKIAAKQPKDFDVAKTNEVVNKEAEAKEEKKEKTTMDDDVIEGMEDFDEVLDRFDDSKADKVGALEKLEEEILVGDAFKDESEVAAEAEENSNVDSSSDDDEEDEEDEDDPKSSDEFMSHDDISDDQADYRREAFNNAEMDGMYD